MTSIDVIMEQIVNKVAQSGIITISLEDYLPEKADILSFDLKPFLFKEMILREKEFRTAMTALNWAVYENKAVAVFCSADAIIPNWAYMLISSYLEPYATVIYFGKPEFVYEMLLLKNIESIDSTVYIDKRIVIKGCADKPVPESAFIAITQKLKPAVKSLMYGEPCSTVPVYKKR